MRSLNSDRDNPNLLTKLNYLADPKLSFNDYKVFNSPKLSPKPSNSVGYKSELAIEISKSIKFANFFKIFESETTFSLLILEQFNYKWVN